MLPPPHQKNNPASQSEAPGKREEPGGIERGVDTGDCYRNQERADTLPLITFTLSPTATAGTWDWDTVR